MVVVSNTNRNFVFASTNAGKYAEVEAIALSLGWNCLSASSLVQTCGPVPIVEEKQNSYQENAFLKAEAFFPGVIWLLLQMIQAWKLHRLTANRE